MRSDFSLNTPLIPPSTLLLTHVCPPSILISLLVSRTTFSAAAMFHLLAAVMKGTQFMLTLRLLMSDIQRIVLATGETTVTQYYYCSTVFWNLVQYTLYDT